MFQCALVCRCFDAAVRVGAVVVLCLLCANAHLLFVYIILVCLRLRVIVRVCLFLSSGASVRLHVFRFVCVLPGGAVCVRAMLHFIIHARARACTYVSLSVCVFCCVRSCNYAVTVPKSPKLVKCTTCGDTFDYADPRMEGHRCLGCKGYLHGRFAVKDRSSRDMACSRCTVMVPGGTYGNGYFCSNECKRKVLSH